MREFYSIFQATLPALLVLLCVQHQVQSHDVLFKVGRNVTVHMGETVNIDYQLLLTDGVVHPIYLRMRSPNIAHLNGGKSSLSLRKGHRHFNLTGVFLGRTELFCERRDPFSPLVECNLEITVIRRKRLIDTIFITSVAVLVALIYLNFGCALDWELVIKILKRPIAPGIGLTAQFLLMPLCSFAVAKLLFPNNVGLQLGVFFTGVSPAGGSSNVWTLLLDGNVDLSVTMTTLSTLAAFALMPLWLFTLGRWIFEGGAISVPHRQIAEHALVLIVPLGVGFLLARRWRGVAVAACVMRMLRTFSALLLVFIVIFASVVNYYLFGLFTWQIVVAGMALPYVGFIIGYIMAKLFRQPHRNCLAIAIETGVRNTGIAIFLLRFTLPEPEGDLTTIVPVSVAIMTPLPLLMMYFFKQLNTKRRREGRDKKKSCLV